MDLFFFFAAHILLIRFIPRWLSLSKHWLSNQKPLMLPAAPNQIKELSPLMSALQVWKDWAPFESMGFHPWLLYFDPSGLKGKKGMWFIIGPDSTNLKVLQNRKLVQFGIRPEGSAYISQGRKPLELNHPPSPLRPEGPT